MTNQQLAPTAAPRFSYLGANTSHQQLVPGGPHHLHHPHQLPAAASTRPVTVRSVKRRDKAKTEEKRINAAGANNLHNSSASNPGTPKVTMRNAAEDNAAVMV